ncbi:hypothetical protein [Nocardia sp. NPDC059229]|uniref:hypothetical protein n=1 Tax=Nocardia sp. NPDC059229 TaxID=3346778 RepID=UPI0036A8AFEE
MEELAREALVEVHDRSGIAYRVPQSLLQRFAVISEQERKARHAAALARLKERLAEQTPEERARTERWVQQLLARLENRVSTVDPQT